MDWIMIPLNCLIVFGTIYKVVELFVRKRERLMLISKLAEISNVDFKGINLYSSGNKFTALRIGWLMLGIGAGFLVGFIINLMATAGQYAYDFSGVWQYHDHVAGVVYIACICIFGGIGLLMSYKAEHKAEHPEEKKEEEF
ncbi:MAG: hypothetical protein II826_02510 [Prevotella sp.]|nr:hypothetical protein [Prevotella sp.]